MCKDGMTFVARNQKSLIAILQINSNSQSFVFNQPSSWSEKLLHCHCPFPIFWYQS